MNVVVGEGLYTIIYVIQGKVPHYIVINLFNNELISVRLAL